MSCFGALDEKGLLAGPKPAVGKGFSAEGLAASLYSPVRQKSGLRGGGLLQLLLDRPPYKD